MPDITIYDTHKGNTAYRRSVRRGTKDFVTFEMVSESLVKQEGSGMDKNPQIPFTICQENGVTLLGASETYKPLARISPASYRWDPRGSAQMNTQGDSPSCSGIACWTFNRHVLYPGTNYRQVLICRSQIGHGGLNFWQAPNTSELTDCTLGPLSRGQPTSSPKDHVNILGNLGLTAPAVPL